MTYLIVNFHVRIDSPPFICLILWAMSFSRCFSNVFCSLYSAAFLAMSRRNRYILRIHYVVQMCLKFNDLSRCWTIFLTPFYRVNVCKCLKFNDLLGCHRFYDLAPFTVFDSFSHPFLPCQCLFTMSK